MYYRARYYDPSLGQFISPDTIVPDASNVLDYNRYLYVRGNAINLNDPTGHCAIVCGIALVGAALLLSADTPLSPEEAAKTEASGQIGAALLTGDANDFVTVVAGYDYIANEPVPYFSAEWDANVLMALLPVISATGVRAAKRVISAIDAVDAFDDLAQMRHSLGLKDTDVLARLDLNGQSFYGVNGPGIEHPRLPSTTYQSLRHAEGDAFSQAISSGLQADEATLFVDEIPCGWCMSSFGGYAKSLGIERLDVYTPEGLFGSYDSARGTFQRAVTK